MKNGIALIILLAVSFGTFSQEEAENSGERKFALKFCPTQLVAGEFNFSYEQRIAPIFSLELEVGPTISQFGLNFGNQRLWQGDNGLGFWDFESIDSRAKPSIGIHVSIAPRFYPMAQDNPMKGLYLSPVVKYRRYNYINEDLSDVLDDAQSYVDQMIYRFNLGLQFWPGDGNFSIDMYFGVGLSTYNLKGNRYFNTVTNEGNVQTQWDTYRDNGIRLNVATGLKFGFGM